MCPDFPAVGGATAAQVWAYATRAITDKAGFTISGTKQTLDALNDITSASIWAVATRALTDKVDFALTTAEKGAIVDLNWDELASGHVGAGSLGKRLDADMSTRSSHAAADVWAVAARTITALTGQPRTDIVGSDASFEAATGRPAKLDDIPYFEAVVEGSLLMTGVEQTLVEKTDDKAGLLEGMINLTPMTATETCVVREYMQVLSTGAYAKYAEETYSGAQTIPLLQLLTRISTHDIKVTIQQTAGTYKTLEYSFVRRREA